MLYLLGRVILILFHLKFRIPAALTFQLQVYYKVDRLQTGLTAQQIGTTAWRYLNKASLFE